MPTSHDQCYNGQVAVEEESQMIVSTSLTNNAADVGQMMPLLSRGEGGAGGGSRAAPRWTYSSFEEEGGWSPYLSLEDAGKLDAVRDALRAGDITRGAKLATRLYRLTPVEA